MLEGIRKAQALFPAQSIRIGAQQYLERFYMELGFRAEGDPYVEDGIPHIEMVLLHTNSDALLIRAGSDGDI